MIAGIRVPVWIASGALGLLAFLALHPPQPVERASVAAALGNAVAPVAPALVVAPVSALAVRTALPAPAAVSSAGAAVAAHATRSAPPGRAQEDSRLAADLRILEDDAAQLAEARRLVDVAALEDSLRRVVPEPGAAREDARRELLADAALVEHFVQDAYRGTEFPIGYPAAERTRAAAESQVRALGAEQRRDLLDVLLQGEADAMEPIGPQFAPLESGFVWEGALR